MTKTTFLGYVPSLKSKHEATIVNGRAMKSKGGSIRYLLEGEYDGRKTLPKTVSKADFESVYGFDAKEAESAIIIGKNKKGDVDVLGYTTDAKDKTGFTPEKIVKWDDKELKDLQNYSNHDAESVLVVGKVDGPFGKQLEVAGHVKGVTDKKGFTPTNIQSYDHPILEGSVMDEGLKSNLVNHADTVGSPSPADVEPPAPSEKPFPQEPSNENFSAETEVKEALGLFGKKDEEEEEESDEPKTQEFTVVLQEGDKLELTDIAEEENEEEQAAPDDENTEKEAETLEITDIDWETDDEDVDLPASVLVPSSVVEDEIADYLSDEYGFLVRGYVLNAETYEAVQAKVTRPVKEDETEDEEESDEEGLSTGAKVALGVGALAAGVALFGAEDDPYENQTDYSRIYGASGSGEKEHDMIAREEEVMYEFRYDNPITYYEWTTGKEKVSDEEEDYIHDAISDEIGNEPSEGDDNFGIYVEDVGSVDVDTDTDYGEARHYGLAAEHESESDGYAYAYTKGHEDGMGDEVIYRPRIATDKGRNIYKKILKQKAEGVHISGIKDDKRESRLHIVGDEDADGFTPKEISDFDTNKLTPYETNLSKRLSNNHGAETFEAEKMGWDIKEYGNKDKYASKDGVEVIIAPIRKSSYQYHPRDAKWKLTYGRETPHGVVPLAKLFGTYEDVFRWLNNPPFEVKSFGADTNFSAEGYDGKGRPANKKEQAYMNRYAKKTLNEWRGKQSPSGIDPAPIVDVVIYPPFGKEDIEFKGKHYEYDLYFVLESGNWSHIGRADYEMPFYEAETVGNPSPSGPSSTPEPAEATGSEPSNEEFKGENRNLAIGLTAAGVGLVALLGADRIKKLFDRFNL